MALERVTSGQIFRDMFASLSGWTDSSGGAFSVSLSPSVVCSPRHPTPLLAPPHPSGQTNGFRELQLYQEDSTHWFLLGDAGNGSTNDATNGWRQFLKMSTDRGLTWTDLGAISIGLTNGDGGSWRAVATGWTEKRGNTYYLHRVTTNAAFVPPDYGLPADPYRWDIWSTTDSPATWCTTASWTFVRNVPLTSGSWADTTYLPGSTYFDGSTYHNFPEGYSGTPSYSIGRATSPSPGGLQTSQGAIQGAFSDGRTPENARVFNHAGISRYAMLMNLIAPAGTHTDQNAVMLSSSLTNWSGAVTRRFQRVCPSDGTNVVGVASHVTGPDGALVASADGYVPIVFDADGTETAPGYHSKRSGFSATLEPAPTGLVFSDSSSTAKRITRTLTNSNFTAEYSPRFSDGGQNLFFAFIYRMTGTNYYRVSVRSGATLLFQRFDGGVLASTVVGTGTLTSVADFQHRVKFQIYGSSHKVYLDGELQLDVTDATYNSGAEIAFEGTTTAGGGLTTDVRLFQMRTSDVVTFNGVTAGSVVALRDGGGMPVIWAVASTSSISFTLAHWPVHTVSVYGVDFTPSDGGQIVGGDVFDLITGVIGLLSQSGDSLQTQDGTGVLLAQASDSAPSQSDSASAAILSQTGDKLSSQDGTGHLLAQFAITAHHALRARLIYQPRLTAVLVRGRKT